MSDYTGPLYDCLHQVVTLEREVIVQTRSDVANFLVLMSHNASERKQKRKHKEKGNV